MTVKNFVKAYLNDFSSLILPNEKITEKTISIKNILLEIKKNNSKVITLTGHEKNNSLSQLGDINLWINSKIYNFIENIHQLWLLTACDLIIGKREYLSK